MKPLAAAVILYVLSGRSVLPASAAKKIAVARLYGSLHQYAYYFLDILVGSPAQRQSVIIDTGSSLLGFPCKECPHCGNHIDEPFDFSASTTAEWLTCKNSRCNGRCGPDQRCRYTQAYNEGSSIAGAYFSDMVSIGDAERENEFVRFDYIGCHDKETNLFTSQKASGICGIAYGRDGQTLIDAVFASDAVDTHVFALCLADDGGVLTVGGYNASLHIPSESWSPPDVQKIQAQRLSNAEISGNEISWRRLEAIGGATRVPPPITWTALSSTEAFNVNLVGMKIDGKIIGSNAGAFGRTLIDSGTTYSYFPPDTYRTILSQLSQICKRFSNCSSSGLRGVKPPCWEVGDVSELDLVPSIFLEFEDGAKFEWKARSYLFKKSRTGWCAAFDNNHDRSTILGMSFLKNNDVIFERERDLVGFSSANCPEFFSSERPPPPEGVNVHEPEELTETDEADGTSSWWGAVGAEIVPPTDPGSALPQGMAPPPGGFNQIPSDADIHRHHLYWAVGSGFVGLIVALMGCVALQTLRRTSHLTAAYSSMPDMDDDDADFVTAGRRSQPGARDLSASLAEPSPTIPTYLDSASPIPDGSTADFVYSLPGVADLAASQPPTVSYVSRFATGSGDYLATPPSREGSTGPVFVGSGRPSLGEEEIELGMPLDDGL